MPTYREEIEQALRDAAEYERLGTIEGRAKAELIRSLVLRRNRAMVDVLARVLEIDPASLRGHNTLNPFATHANL